MPLRAESMAGVMEYTFTPALSAYWADTSTSNACPGHTSDGYFMSTWGCLSMARLLRSELLSQ